MGYGVHTEGVRYSEEKGVWVRYGTSAGSVGKSYQYSGVKTRTHCTYPPYVPVPTPCVEGLLEGLEDLLLR